MDKFKTNTLKKDYTLKFRNYGTITVPKGTQVSNKTAEGFDDNYNFVTDFNWIEENYPTIKDLLKHDAYYYGINVPKEYLN